MLKTAEKIATYLSTFSSEKGLYDPLESKILPHYYGNSFYALSCSLLYNKTKKKIWKERLEEALKNELRYTKERFKKVEMFRWEFKNYAFLKILLNKNLTKDLEIQVRKRIRDAQDEGSFKTNWIAMRALNNLMTAQIRQSKKYQRRAKKELQRVLQRQTPEGLFFDAYESNSFQYHNYILSLLIQYYDYAPHKELEQQIKKGLDVLINITDPQGDCGYFGRGQEQVFGYVAAIYALSYAAKKWDKKYGPYAKQIFSYIEPYLEKNKIIANEDEALRAGWYKYNCSTDYLAFAAAYLLLAEQYLNLKNTKYPKPREYEIFLENSEVFIKRTKEYFIVVCAGNKEPSELPGTVHLYPRIIPCSGGPYVNARGKEYIHNFMGIGKENILFKKKGKFKRENESLELRFHLKEMQIVYTWKLTKDITFSAEIIPQKKITINPLHYCSWESLDGTKPEGEIVTPKGRAQEFVHTKVSTDKKIKRTLVLYKGKKEPEKISAIYRSKVNRQKFLGQKIEHYCSLGLNKLIQHPKDFLYLLAFSYIRNKYKRR